MRRDLLTSAARRSSSSRVAVRARLPAGRHRRRAGRLPGQGRRQADRARRQGRRLAADRPGLRAAPGATSSAPVRPTRATARPPPPSPTSGPNSKDAARHVHGNLAAYLELERPYDPRPRARATCRSTPSRPPPRASTRTSRRPTRDPGPPRRRVRGLPLDRVRELIAENTDGRFLGVLGEPGVNVLELNLALDKETPMTHRPRREQRSLARPLDPAARRSSQSLRKLDPRVQVRNPVMFVVEVGAVITTVGWLIQVFGGDAARRRRRAGVVHLHRRRLAVADRGLRQPRRGARRGPRQGAGRQPARDAHRDRRAAARRRRRKPAAELAAATSSSSRRAR